MWIKTGSRIVNLNRFDEVRIEPIPGIGLGWVEIRAVNREGYITLTKVKGEETAERIFKKLAVQIRENPILFEILSKYDD